MNVENWDEDFEATITIDNDANDYYYTWVDFKDPRRAGYSSLEEMFEKVLGIGFDPLKVRIKTFKGALFIQCVPTQED